jgi:hypothetical protein
MAMDSGKKPRAFVLMPFAEDFKDIFDDLISVALPDYEVVRADSRLDERNILAKIVSGIADADLIIADLTRLNANVMYELGDCSHTGQTDCGYHTKLE